MPRIHRVALVVGVFLSFGVFAAGQEPAAKPKLKVEFRWADYTPTKGLTEEKGIDLSCTDKKAYLHKKVVLTNADIAKALLTKANAAPGEKYNIEAYLNKEAGEKLAKASKENLRKPLVVLIDGKVIAAMVVMNPLTDFVPITGTFTEAEGERIIKGIK